MEESEISFFYEDCGEFEIENPNNTFDWLKQIILNNKQQLGVVNYIFCSDDYLHKINLEYLDHDTYTDIITFDNADEEGIIEGDIYVSVARVKENAKTHLVDFNHELHRVLAHGVLHLIGFNDKTKDEELEMRKQEEDCLSLFQF